MVFLAKYIEELETKTGLVEESGGGIKEPKATLTMVFVIANTNIFEDYIDDIRQGFVDNNFVVDDYELPSNFVTINAKQHVTEDEERVIFARFSKYYAESYIIDICKELIASQQPEGYMCLREDTYTQLLKGDSDLYNKIGNSINE